MKIAAFIFSLFFTWVVNLAGIYLFGTSINGTASLAIALFMYLYLIKEDK